MRKIYKKLNRIEIILITAILTIIFLIIIMPAIDNVRSPETISIIEFQLTFSKETFIYNVNQWGEEAINNYVSMMWVDYIFPVIYSIFLASSIALLTTRLIGEPNRIHIILFSLPLFAGLLDWVENTFHIYLLADFSNITNQSSTLIFLSGIVALLKWSLVLFSLLVIFYYGCLRIMKGK